MNKEARPPKQIWYSLYAFLGTVALALASSVLNAVSYGVRLHLLDVEVGLVDAAIVVLLILLMVRRKRWARTVYAVLTGLLVFGVLVAILAPFGGLMPMRRVVSVRALDLISLFLQLCLRVLSVGFLYTRPSREWFNTSCVDSNQVQGGSEERTCDSPPISHGEVLGAASPLQTTSVQAPAPALESDVATRPRFWLEGMKKRALLAGALILGVVGVCLLILVVPNRGRATKADAIRRALSADVALSRQIYGNQDMYSSNAKIIEAYTQGLRRIDMSRCPRDFQMAYLEHIQAWESLARSRDSVDLIGPLFEFLVLKRIPKIPDSPDERPIREEIAKTWDRVERIALSYGVRVPQ